MFKKIKYVFVGALIGVVAFATMAFSVDTDNTYNVFGPNVSTAPGNANYSLAECDSGDAVVSGGYQLSVSSGGIAAADTFLIPHARPHHPSQYSVTMVNTGYRSVNVQSYAICVEE